MTKPDMSKRGKKSLIGKVWAGFIGEYKKPPIYIIITPGIEGKTVFVDDIFKRFIGKKVSITIKETQ